MVIEIWPSLVHILTDTAYKLYLTGDCDSDDAELQ